MHAILHTLSRAGTPSHVSTIKIVMGHSANNSSLIDRSLNVDGTHNYGIILKWNDIMSFVKALNVTGLKESIWSIIELNINGVQDLMFINKFKDNGTNHQILSLNCRDYDGMGHNIYMNIGSLLLERVIQKENYTLKVP